MRSQVFLDAAERFGCIGDLVDPELDGLEAVERFYVSWMDRYQSGRCVRLRKGDEFVFVRMVNRFMPKYKEYLKKRLFKVRWNDKGERRQWDFMLTLTMRPMGSLKNEFNYVSSRWCRVRAWLFKWFRHFSYLKVLEVTKKGRPHLHVLLSSSGCTRIETEDLYDESGKRLFYGLRTVWGHFVKVRGVWKGFDAVSYCVKYLNKTMMGVKQDVRYASLLFASNKRMFSISRDLECVKRVREAQGFAKDGVVVASDFECYLRDMGYDVNLDFLRCKVDWRHSELFGFEGVI